jgi:hypothetical protein
LPSAQQSACKDTAGANLDTAKARASKERDNAETAAKNLGH